MASYNSSYQTPLIVEDVVRGLNDWRNIQEVVRLAFKSLHDLVKAQAVEISHLQTEISNRPTKAEIEKITSVFVETDLFVSTIDKIKTMTEVTNDQLQTQEIGLIQLKTTSVALLDDIKEIKHVVGISGGSRSSMTEELQKQGRTLQLLNEEVERKADKCELQNYASLDSMREKASFGDLSRKADVSMLTDALLNMVTKDELNNEMKAKANINQMTDGLASKLDQDTYYTSMAGKMKRTEVLDLVDKKIQNVQLQVDNLGFLRDDFASKSSLVDIVTLLDRKANLSDVTRELNMKLNHSEFTERVSDKVTKKELGDALTSTTEAIATEVKSALQSTQKEIVQILNKKAYKVDVKRALNDFVRSDELIEILEKKADIEDVKEALDSKADIFEVKKNNDTGGESNKKINDNFSSISQRLADLATFVDNMDLDAWRDPTTKIMNELSTKASTEDIMALINRKTSVEDLNLAVSDLKNNLFSFATKKEVQSLSDDAVNVKKLVDSELSLGRWIWRSGRLISIKASTNNNSVIGGVVPWNVQCINSKSENFIWEPDCESITCVAPGLYEVTAGFFTDTVPRIRILVNGESVLTAASAATSRSSNGVLRRTRHSAGTVTGWTVIDFLALPSRAKISVLYDGDDSTQGFLGLRKLNF